MSTGAIARNPIPTKIISYTVRYVIELFLPQYLFTFHGIVRTGFTRKLLQRRCFEIIQIKLNFQEKNEVKI